MKETLEFLAELAVNNNKEWFDANRARYQACRDRFIAFSTEYISRLTKIDPTRIPLLPDDLKPTMKDAWEAFCFLTSDWSGAEREALWFATIGKVAPGKDQIDFTEAEWSRVVSEMKASC